MHATRLLSPRLLLLLVGLLLLTPVEARAASPTPAQKCLTAKLGAAGEDASSRLLCESRGLAGGADPACVARAMARRTAAFQAADARGGCLTTGDDAVIGAVVDTLVADVLDTLAPVRPAASRCTTTQIGAIGRSVRKILTAYARDARNPDGARLAKALIAADPGSTFARAARAGDCLTSTLAVTVAAQVDQRVTVLRAKLQPTCGDGIQAGSEACDGSDTASCTGACANDCTCVVGCGDHVVGAGEQCDGTGCDAADPTGCFPPGAAAECQCCAKESPCYVRGFVPSPVEVPCCTGVCDIPGPEAGPNVMTYCTEPPATPCPCWTSASLDATFPPGYFDANQRGGAVCFDDGTAFGVGTADTCVIHDPQLGTVDVQRSGAGVVAGHVCSLLDELDPGNTGSCARTPIVHELTPAQFAACEAALRGSQMLARECP